jgi:hypothetical protein
MDGVTEKLYPSPHFRHSPYAAVAQWIEYWPPKPRVVGSIPASRTINSRTYRISDLCISVLGYAWVTFC